MQINPADLILWEDDDLLVVSKPAGLPTLVDGQNPQAPYLVALLKGAYDPLWTVHRLDRETSGVMVFARTAAAHQALNAQFENRQVHKLYHALVIGDPDWNEKTIEIRLRPDGDRKHRTLIDSKRGKPAVTRLRVLDRFGLYTLVEASPRTGRTHQLRVHLAAAGYPIVADSLYGEGKKPYRSEFDPSNAAGNIDERPLLNRLGLHARSLSFQRPETGEMKYFQATYPKDFRRVLKLLQRYCEG